MTTRHGAARRTRRKGRRGLIVTVLMMATALVGALTTPVTAQAATQYVPITGAGSTWAENAITQWTGDVAQYGMQVSYAGTGSSDGRTAFGSNQVDFAASDIAYGTFDNGTTDSGPAFPYAYIPVVAGGTAFMYNLTIAGKRVTNLRLSGQTIAKIFTNDITTWNDPEIVHENPGLSLPALQITPVVRSDGSGTSAQLTSWMSAQFPSIYNPYCQASGRTQCGVTSYYPLLPNSNFSSQALDSGVAGYVAQSTSDGAITYTELSYAKNANFPVAYMLNSAGYYTAPTPQNVAVSLVAATLNMDASDPTKYLTENLTNVWTDSDPRTYPLSAYSYLIVPQALNSSFTAQKGVTLSAFINYLLCQGQQTMGPLGYSPLPINLVQAGFAQVAKIPGATANTTPIASCNNPTFSTNGTNTLVSTAPQPAACALQGPAQCAADGTTPIPGSAGSGTTGGTGGKTSGGTTGGKTSGGTTGGTGGQGPAASGTAAAGPGGGPTSVADTIGANLVGGLGAAPENVQDLDAVAVPVSVGTKLGGSVGLRVAGVAAAFLLAAIIGPPLVSRRRKGRRS